MTRLGCLALLLLVGRSTVAAADFPEAQELLRRAAQGMRTLRYEGEHLVQLRRPASGAVLQRDRIYQDGDRLRIEPMKPGRQDRRPVIIVSHGVRQVYHPQQKMLFRYLLKEGQRASGPLAEAGPASKNLRCQVVAEETIAKRPTWLIEIRRRNQVLAARLWIDKDKLMPLKRENYNLEGQLVDARTFLSINFEPTFGPDKFEIPETADLQVRTVALQTRSLETLRRETAAGGFRLVGTEGLEKHGFRFDSGDVTQDPATRQLEEVWLRFSSTHGRLSIFQRRDRGMAIPEKNLPQQGQVVLQRNGWLLTVVGAFKPRELQQFAEALEGPAAADR